MSLEAWESYFWPGTQVLRNKLDERDPVALAVAEAKHAAKRAVQIERGRVTIPRTWDGEHLCAIHRHLFRDVYGWAGHYRIVEMSKVGGRPFAATDTIEDYLRDAHSVITSTAWPELDRAGFARATATVYALVNHAHPFREGNGRAAKIFLRHVAERSRFTLHYSRIAPARWNLASAMSGPDLGAYQPVVDPLVPVFARVAVQRPDPASTAPTASTRRSRLPRRGGPEAGHLEPRAPYRSDPGGGHRLRP